VEARCGSARFSIFLETGTRSWRKPFGPVRATGPKEGGPKGLLSDGLRRMRTVAALGEDTGSQVKVSGEDRRTEAARVGANLRFFLKAIDEGRPAPGRVRLRGNLRGAPMADWWRPMTADALIWASRVRPVPPASS